MQFVCTTGKRIELFIETMDSIINNVEAFDSLKGYFLTIDSDNFEYERDLAKERYPFFNEIINVHGYMHYTTLNKLWFDIATDDYIYHNEDDRVIIRKDNYLIKAAVVLDQGEYQQVVIGDKPQVKGKEIKILDEVYFKWPHDKDRTDKLFKGRQWAELGGLDDSSGPLWPDFTLAPSIINRKWLVDNHIKFMKMHNFERNLGYRVCDKGFKRVTFKEISHLHKGLQQSLYDILGRQR